MRPRRSCRLPQLLHATAPEADPESRPRDPAESSATRTGTSPVDMQSEHGGSPPVLPDEQCEPHGFPASWEAGLAQPCERVPWKRWHQAWLRTPAPARRSHPDASCRSRESRGSYRPIRTLLDPPPNLLLPG